MHACMCVFIRTTYVCVFVYANVHVFTSALNVPYSESFLAFTSLSCPSTVQKSFIHIS